MASGHFKAPIGALRVVKSSAHIVTRDPQILFYPLLALLFISVTYPLLAHSVLHNWYDQLFSPADRLVPHSVGAVIGLVGFSAFYVAIVSAIFVCAVSAATLAKLDGRRTVPLYGLLAVYRHLFRVARFATLSVFLFPISVYAQRRKLPRGTVGVVGSSITLHMANLAPAIFSTKKPYGETVRDSIEILGSAWKEGLILKVGMYLLFSLVVVMPKLIQHSFFTSPSASNVGWLISLELGASGYVVFKVINAIFMSVLYHHAKNRQ